MRRNSDDTLTVYHGDNFGSISLTTRAMYLPNARCEEGPGIYFTTNKRTAQAYGRDILIAQIDPSKFLPSRATAHTVLRPEEVSEVIVEMGIDPSGVNIERLMDLEVRELLIRLIKLTPDVDRFISAWNDVTGYDGTIYEVPFTETTRTIPGEKFIAVLNPDLDVSKDYSGVSMRGDDLSGMDLTGSDFSKSTLKDVNLAGADLSGAVFASTEFINVNAEGARFENVQGWYSFQDCNVRGANFQSAEITMEAYDSDFRDADFKGAFTDEGAKFINCDLRGSDFEGAEFPYLGYSRNTKLPELPPRLRKYTFVEDE